MLDDTINSICNEIKANRPDQAAAGRKNRGISKKNNDDYKRFQKELRKKPQKIQKIDGEIVSSDDLEQFRIEYNSICSRVLAQFKADNKELTEKYPYLWYKQLLIELKKYCPPITYNEIDKCFIVWDALTLLLNTIGLYITVETFYLFTGTYKYQFEKKAGESPKHAAFLKKIYFERDLAMENELAYNPYNQTNKIYLHKLHGFVEEGKTQHIEVSHSIRDFDNLPMFSSSENN